MDFEKKYPIPQNLNEHILVQWSRGYKRVEVYFQDKLIGTVEGSKHLIEGVRFPSDQGTIGLKLSEDPITIDVTVDGFHSPNNVSHPKKQLKKSATFFWIIFSFAVIGSLIEGMQISVSPYLGIVISFNTILLVGYLISAIFVGQSKPWAFYLGFSIYSLTTFFALLTLFFGNFLTILVFIIRGVILYFLITNIKHAVATHRHNQLNKLRSSNLLDQ